jgi:2-C-methyl-D-erythritol 2,4-cyclodiphosphate synthase
MDIKVAIGQDSHRFEEGCGRADGGGGNAYDFGAYGVSAYCRESSDCAASCDIALRRPLLLGGVEFAEGPPLAGNSDADVVLHALCNAISGVTGVNIIGEAADRMRTEREITDSAEYVREALKYFTGGRITHISLSIECARPVITPRIAEMRVKIAELIDIGVDGVCITATSGEGLTDFGRGLGIQVFCALTAIYE